MLINKLKLSNAAIFVTALGTGCGGGSEAVSPRQQTALDATRASPAVVPTVNSPLHTPVPEGATRYVKFTVYSLYDDTLGHTAGRTTALVARFDALKIPINIVHCGTHVEREDHTGANIAFVLILDIRHDGLEAARASGFEELTAQNSGFYISPADACFYGQPTMSIEQRLHGYAQRVYPDLFLGRGNVGEYERFRYRLYDGTGNYLGLDGNEVYVHNARDWHFLRVGNVKDFIPYIEGIPAAMGTGAAR